MVEDWLCGRAFRSVGRCCGGRSGRRLRLELFELGAAGRAPEAVIADLREAAREDMLEKPAEELRTGERGAADLTGTVVAVTEGDLAVVDAFDPAVGDGDAKQVTAQIGQDGGAGAGRLAVNDPVGVPNFRRGLIEESGAVQGIADFGAEDGRESADRDEEAAAPGRNPTAIGSESARTDEHVDVGMVEHGAGPGVEDGQACRPAAEVAGIIGEFEQGPAGRAEQKVVDDLRMGACQ